MFCNSDGSPVWNSVSPPHIKQPTRRWELAVCGVTRAARARSLAGNAFPPSKLMSIAAREGSPISDATSTILGVATSPPPINCPNTHSHFDDNGWLTVCVGRLMSGSPTMESDRSQNWVGAHLGRSRHQPDEQVASFSFV